MSTRPGVADQAKGHYRRAFRRTVRHPIGEVEAEAHHLREVEAAGESGATPLIAILGLLLFLAPVAALLIGLGFAAYYIFA